MTYVPPTKSRKIANYYHNLLTFTIFDRIDVDVRVSHGPTSLSRDIHEVSFEQFPVLARYSCKNNVHTQRFGVRSTVSYKNFSRPNNGFTDIW